MIKDIDISHYYKKFIETSNDDMAKYNKELELINKMKLIAVLILKVKIKLLKMI
mgnify:CR=1 FL=1